MRIVEGPLDYMPKHCIITGSPTGTFVDFEVDWVAHCDPRIYIHTAIIEKAAWMLGMAPAEEVEALRKEVEDLRRRFAEQDRLLSAYQELDSAMHAHTEEAANADAPR